MYREGKGGTADVRRRLMRGPRDYKGTPLLASRSLSRCINLPAGDGSEDFKCDFV